LKTTFALCAGLLAGLALLPTAAISQETKQIRVAIGDAPYKQAFDALAINYEKLHLGVDVEIMVIPSDGYATWIRTAVAGGLETAPDIFSPNYTQGFFEAGKSISLNPYLQTVSPYTGKLWAEGFVPEHLAMVRIDGEHPSIPYNFIEIGLFYNKALFKKAGVEVPRTWAELETTCTRLREFGLVPMAVPSDFENVWAGSFGWLVRIVTDSAFYFRLEAIRARPGDFNFSPANDANFTLDPTNPFSDLSVSVNMERYLQAILDGELRYDGDEMRAVYTLLRGVSKHWQKGFLATNFNAAYQLFLTQRAAIMMHHSGAILGLQYDIDKLNADDRFDWGVFQFPDATADSAFHLPFRGVGGPIPIYGIVRKHKEQQDLAADFLMYMSAPDNARQVMETMLANKQSLIGPFAIRDVQLPPDLEEKFSPFLSRGREKMQLRGLYDEQQATWRWVLLVQDLMGDAITMDEFLAQYQITTVEAITRLIHSYDLDMDPTTRDNNKILETDLRDAVKGLKASDEEPAETLAAALRELARPVVVAGPEASPAALILDRTIPIVLVRTESEAAEVKRDASIISRRLNQQYVAIVTLGGQASTVEVISFRPSPAEVIKKAAGKRYTEAELDRIWGRN
jgi:ABC-type glycerol-3-phosphate transport system substrate-binding protein